jgi:glycogenin glucosyltransferase
MWESGSDWSFATGALVLAHSLRDTGTEKKLAVLYTAEGVSVDAVAELRV